MSKKARVGVFFVNGGVLFLLANVAALEIILSLCFDKWKKCTTFANVKVCKTQACVPVKTFE